jgi:uncharacterized membrane-anchored protein
VKTRWLIIVVVLQVLTLAYMAGEREWVLRFGQTIHLRTAPLDPQDAMRGDYVRLDYEIAHVPRNLCRGGFALKKRDDASMRQATRVYASLSPDENGLAQLVTLSDTRPADGLYIRGRLEPFWENEVNVHYGLEAYFQEQGQAKVIEEARTRAGIQVPLEMAVAVSPAGLAVLKGHRWSNLGIGLDLGTTARPNGANRNTNRLVTAKISLLNSGSNDLAIVDRENGRSLALVTDSRWGENPWHWVNEERIIADTQPPRVIVLKPGEIHCITLDLADAVWFLREKKNEDERTEPKALADVPQGWPLRFRFEYRPPDRSASRNLPHAPLIWHGRLPTRAFGATGVMVD